MPDLGLAPAAFWVPAWFVLGLVGPGGRSRRNLPHSDRTEEGSTRPPAKQFHAYVQGILCMGVLVLVLVLCGGGVVGFERPLACLLYTSPSPRD